jgi:acyl-coenzyme A synthetase/AMP-(fatty) acid ligase
MFSGRDGIIEPRTFLPPGRGRAAWASLLRERRRRPGDRVVVLLGAAPRGWRSSSAASRRAVTVPCSPHTSASSRRSSPRRAPRSSSRISLRRLLSQLASPEVQHVEEAALERSTDAIAATPTHETSSATSPSSCPQTTGERAAARRSHARRHVRDARAGQHWLDASRSDAVWCTAGTGSAQAIWTGLLGPWARGPSSFSMRVRSMPRSSSTCSIDST